MKIGFIVTLQDLPFEGFNIPTIKYDTYQSSFSNRAETSYQKESYSTTDFSQS